MIRNHNDKENMIEELDPRAGKLIVLRRDDTEEGMVKNDLGLVPCDQQEFSQSLE